MDELAQDELGRGGQDPMDWARREIMVEEWRMAGTDYARLRRGVPAGANPVTFVENILGANARALGLSGVRIDPETGKAITPDQLFKENPVAADDPIVNRNLRAYIKTYNTWLNDPSQEVPSGVKVARDGNAQSLANNPNVDFYSINPDDPTAPRENTFGVMGPDGRVVEKQPKQRRDERKARNSQVKNMAGRNLLAPGDPNFGLKRWADGRVRASGRRLPQSIILQNHWKPWLPIINTIESLADSGESMQVRYFAKGNSADKVKTARFTDVDAINREVVFDQWTTNADGDLLAQLLDMTTLRNRAMRAIGERNPALDPANGGPGYSLQAIMDDVNQWMADKRAGKAGEATIGPDRKNIVNALINPGTTLNRSKNPLAGSMGKGSAIKTLILEGINAVSGTGRKGAAMDYNWANGNFMPDQPPPRPDVDIDLPQERMPQQIPREAQGMPDVAASGRGDGMPDGDYMAAVERGDENAARKIMEDAIKPSLFFEHVTKGKVRPFWHHKRTAEDFTTFRTPAWFSKNKEYVQELKGPIDYKPTDLEASQPYFLTPDIIDKGSFKDHRVLSIDGVDLARTAWKGKTWEEKLPFIELPDRDQVYPFHDWQYGEGVLEQPGVLDAIKEQGYQIIHIKERGFDTYAVLDPNIIKPADAVLRDGAGNVIPPSQRLGKQ
jgi:hypothetical protein